MKKSCKNCNRHVTCYTAKFFQVELFCVSLRSIQVLLTKMSIVRGGFFHFFPPKIPSLGATYVRFCRCLSNRCCNAFVKTKQKVVNRRNDFDIS